MVLFKKNTQRVYNASMTVIEETIKVTKCICERCGYMWNPKDKENLPTVCASKKCKSPYWNIPRKNKKNLQKLAINN